VLATVYEKIFMADLKIVFQHLLEGSEEARDNIILDSQFPNRNLTQDFQNTKDEV
jgi:hypothetical protein